MGRAENIVGLCFLAAILLLSSNKVAAQYIDELLKQERAEGKLFSIKLRPEAIKVWKDVEKRAGKPVIESLVDDSGGADVARSWIDNNGTPVIQIMGRRGLNEDSIVHELFHLHLIVRGFPRFISCPTANQTSPELVKYIAFARAEIDNAVQHWMFYPKMRQIGLKPQDGYDKLSTLSERSDWNDLTVFMLREGRILHYFRTALEIDDPTIVKHFTTWYVVKGWNEELQIAQQMMEIVKKANLSSPRKVLQIVNRCLQKIARKDFNLGVGKVTMDNYRTYKSMSACIIAVPSGVPLQTLGPMTH